MQIVNNKISMLQGESFVYEAELNYYDNEDGYVNTPYRLLAVDGLYYLLQFKVRSSAYSNDTVFTKTAVLTNTTPFVDVNTKLAVLPSGTSASSTYVGYICKVGDDLKIVTQTYNTTTQLLEYQWTAYNSTNYPLFKTHDITTVTSSATADTQYANGCLCWDGTNYKYAVISSLTSENDTISVGYTWKTYNSLDMAFNINYSDTYNQEPKRYQYEIALYSGSKKTDVTVVTDISDLVLESISKVPLLQPTDFVIGGSLNE